MSEGPFIGGFVARFSYMNVPVSTVKNRLHSARHRLRDDLMDLVDELHQARPSRDDDFKEKTMHAIADPNLERVVRDMIGKPTGDFDVSDLAEIRALDARDCACGYWHWRSGFGSYIAIFPRLLKIENYLHLRGKLL